MKITCEYCGGFLQDTEEFCPNCGAVNKNVMRSADGIPKTIEELKAFAISKNLPLEQMRFFIGENITEPRAFGIYKDEYGNFVVYKNKSDGSRIVRYEGKDEAYAVNELYQKMRTEVMEQKAHQAVNSVHGRNKYGRPTSSGMRPVPGSRGNMGYPSQRGSERTSPQSKLVVTLILIICFIAFWFAALRLDLFDLLAVVTGDETYATDDYDYGYGGGYDYGDGGYGGYGGYDYDDDYDSWGDDWDDDDWDSDWGTDSWDSGYTDWDSDW